MRGKEEKPMQRPVEATRTLSPPREADRIDLSRLIPFLLVHIAALGVFLVPFKAWYVGLAAGLERAERRPLVGGSSPRAPPALGPAGGRPFAGPARPLVGARGLDLLGAQRGDEYGPRRGPGAVPGAA